MSEPNAAFVIRSGYPDLRDFPALGRRNLVNVALTLWVPIPAVISAVVLFHWFPEGAVPPDPGLVWPGSADEAVSILLHHSLLTVNLLFLLFVDLQFWLIALAQRSSWLIDPYWTLLPPLLAFFHFAHPFASPDVARSALALGLLAIWSLRLTWNYFRREGWRFGVREDWRYAKMRAERPLFWLEQLVVVYAVQHVLLVGLSLPFWAIAFRDVPFGALDAALLLAAAAGLVIAHAADTRLDRFMRDNEARSARGERKILILEDGLWRISRHPNYFGEQMFWWSVAGIGVVCGEPWVVLGTAANSAVLAGVTVMSERRMLAVPERREAFLAYRRRTSVWVPWWPRHGGTAADREHAAGKRERQPSDS